MGLELLDTARAVAEFDFAHEGVGVVVGQSVMTLAAQRTLARKCPWHLWPPPIYLRTHLPEGTQGGREATCHGQPLIGTGHETPPCLQAQDFDRQASSLRLRRLREPPKGLS